MNDHSIFDLEQPAAGDPFLISEDSDFDFAPSQSDNLIDLNEDIADLTEQVRFMDCVCLKCSEKTEVDLEQLPENGFVINCRSCNKQIHIVRESCACRAKRKSFEINCAACGMPLDQHAHCHSCGLIFPDYFVSFDPNDARRKARSKFFSNKLAAVRNINFSFKPDFSRRSQNIAGYSPQAITVNTSAATSRLLSKKFSTLAIRLIVPIVLIAAGIFGFNYYKAGQSYAENYIKALYCIKMGVETNVNACSTLKTEWETASGLGRSFTPGTIIKDEAKSLRLRSEADKFMQKMSNPPKRFLSANEGLTKIHGIFMETESLVQSKPNSLQELTNSVDNINKKMTLASQDLKSKLPDSLKQDLEKAKLKYRGLNNF
jgi:hypothetical protein